MSSQQRAELTKFIRKTAKREVRQATAEQGVEHPGSYAEVEADAQIRERLTAIETELRTYRWLAGILVGLAGIVFAGVLALLRFWPK